MFLLLFSLILYFAQSRQEKPFSFVFRPLAAKIFCPSIRLGINIALYARLAAIIGKELEWFLTFIFIYKVSVWFMVSI